MSKQIVIPAVALAGLAALYLSTLQTVPNGSDHYFMIDAGETQIVLNTWGTLHATGYPLYVISGNLIVDLLRAFGVGAAAAPGFVSLFWGVAALGLVYALGEHLSGRPIAALGATILFGLTRTVWIHNSIAEIYTLGLALLALLLFVALYRGDLQQRLYWLAFIGGIGVAHHRALALAAPALIYAVWPQLMKERRELPKIVLISLLLGLAGFLPYVYLPFQAHTGADWVYGEPGTFSGFADQFFGREANRFFGPPESLEQLGDNFTLLNDVLITDLSAPGIIAGIIGLLVALRRPKSRGAALTITLSSGLAYAFHAIFYRDVLSALILGVTLSLALGWMFLLERAVAAAQTRPMLYVLPVGGVLALGVLLIGENYTFIDDLTSDPTGLETIELARNTPADATLMLAWGTRHFAVGFARDVQHDLQDFTLVDHQADFATLAADGRLITAAFTLHNQGPDWWEAQLGAPIILRAAGPNLVQIDTKAQYAQNTLVEDTIGVAEAQLTCMANSITLEVAWIGGEQPQEDLAVFVHLLDSSGNLLAQADQSAPVYGWRPLSTWESGEIVRDVYPLPRLDEAAEIRYGFYRQVESGAFQNEVELSVAVVCDD